jgi:hypothetical protein
MTIDGDLQERIDGVRRREQSFRAAFADITTRCLIELHEQLEAEFDPDGAEHWGDYYGTPTQIDHANALQDEFLAWTTAFDEGEALRRRALHRAT